MRSDSPNGFGWVLWAMAALLVGGSVWAGYAGRHAQSVPVAVALGVVCVACAVSAIVSLIGAVRAASRA